MLSALSTTLDRWIANVIVARARRRWLPLRLVPAAWIRPLVRPSATLIRREVSRTVATTAAVGAFVIVLLLFVSSF